MRFSLTASAIETGTIFNLIVQEVHLHSYSFILAEKK